ncbi:hypothetical protein T440DRAFT_494116 [Plenodomus tracheiphilus IPT5]|uniref:Uncharacterized protein n=1 Tax=Plenodomus tracheiphilus IPT5 TaxID=1408161 RepID=A0A6A7AMK5_9PLEO|nr:hypothetical protein T440DRAFT_494116 [Plenodomus tracheiphilus IPT5]
MRLTGPPNPSIYRPFVLHRLPSNMNFLVIASIPFGFSSLYLLVELYIRYIDSRRQRVPWLSHCQYIMINFGFWLFCITLSAVAMEMRLEAVSVLSYQLGWMQAAVLKVGVTQTWRPFADDPQIYHLRRLLFETLQWPRPYGVLGLTSTACLQCVGAGLCIWDAAPGLTPHWVKCALVPTLHIGWGFHYIILLLWVVWICSVEGTKSEHMRKWRISSLLITPLFISALAGAIPLSLWYPPKTTFLVS